MRFVSLSIAFLASLLFVIPAITAQDEKKDPKNAEKKEGVKDPDKKEPEKKPPVEKLVYGSKFVTLIKSIKPESSRKMSIEVREVDPKKVYDNQVWANQRQQQLAKSYASIMVQRDFRQRQTSLFNYQKDVANYQAELAKRSQNVYSTRTVEVQAAETAKVRAMVPPLEFDDQGFEKKYTKKDLEEMRDKTGLPGFPVEFDQLKSGHYVEIYMAKVAKKAAPKKKGPDDTDPAEAAAVPEYVLVVILPARAK